MLLDDMPFGTDMDDVLIGVDHSQTISSPASFHSDSDGVSGGVPDLDSSPTLPELQDPLSDFHNQGSFDALENTAGSFLPGVCRHSMTCNSGESEGGGTQRRHNAKPSDMQWRVVGGENAKQMQNFRASKGPTLGRIS